MFGFFGGVAFASLFHHGIAFILFVAFLGLLVFLLALPESKIRVLSLVLFFFALGCFRVELVPTRADSPLKELIGKQIILEGVIRKEPDVRENSTRLFVDVQGEHILVVVKKYPEFEYGEKISLTGKIVLPENFANDNGREFDYISYLAKDGIFYEMAFPKIEVLEKGQGNPLVAFLYSF